MTSAELSLERRREALSWTSRLLSTEAKHLHRPFKYFVTNMYYCMYYECFNYLYEQGVIDKLFCEICLQNLNVTFSDPHFVVLCHDVEFKIHKSASPRMVLASIICNLCLDYVNALSDERKEFILKSITFKNKSPF